MLFELPLQYSGDWGRIWAYMQYAQYNEFFKLENTDPVDYITENKNKDFVRVVYTKSKFIPFKISVFI